MILSRLGFKIMMDGLFGRPPVVAFEKESNYVGISHLSLGLHFTPTHMSQKAKLVKVICLRLFMRMSFNNVLNTSSTFIVSSDWKRKWMIEFIRAASLQVLKTPEKVLMGLLHDAGCVHKYIYNIWLEISWYVEVVNILEKLLEINIKKILYNIYSII